MNMTTAFYFIKCFMVGALWAAPFGLAALAAVYIVEMNPLIAHGMAGFMIGLTMPWYINHVAHKLK